MTEAIRIAWKSPGPVASRFMASTAMEQCIEGPIGSGKTGCCLMKPVFLAQKQPPSPRDRIRRFKLCIVRDTYRQLWKTTIPSWWKWMPKDTGEWSGGLNEPAKHTITFDLGLDKGKLEHIMEFVAIGDNTVEDVLRGYEPTAFYLNEADRLSEEVRIYARGRAGRYPDMADGGPAWWGVLMDCNAPEFDSWLHKQITEEWTEGVEYFRQPPGLIKQADGRYSENPHAENLMNLPKGYYIEQSKGQPDWYIDRMLCDEIGYRRDGRPVHPDFRDHRHVAKEALPPVRDLPLVLGVDAGLTPALTVWQWMPNGQWRCLDELVTEPGAGMGPRRFGELTNKLLAERYSGMEVGGWCDPSAMFGGDSEANEKGHGDDRAWLLVFNAVTKLSIRPAPSNKISLRLDAVNGPLRRTIDGETPGLLISPRCKIYRKGFNAGYHYKRVLVAGDNRYQEAPDKNEYSHVHDSGQMALLGGGEYAEVMGRARSRSLNNLPRAAIGGD